MDSIDTNIHSESEVCNGASVDSSGPLGAQYHEQTMLAIWYRAFLLCNVDAMGTP